MAEDEQRIRLWRLTSIVAGGMVLGVLALVLGTSLALDPLDGFRFLGFNLGTYLLVQGLPLAFVVAAFWCASRQERFDRRHGAAEDL